MTDQSDTPPRKAPTAAFRWTIVYVKDVERSLRFYEEALGMTRGFVSETGDYGELDTGTTALAFADHPLAASGLPGGYTRHSPDRPPLATELAFTTSDVPASVAAAVAAGASLLVAPTVKPWGQTVAYVRDPDGVLIEIATPVPGS